MSGIKFTILSHGYIENDYAWNVAVPKPGSLEDKHPMAEWIRVPCFSVLIKHPEQGYILYDTGSCPGDEKDRRPKELQKLFPYYAKREEFLDARLAELGLKPDDISTIVLSHMHWDHSGGLGFFSNTKAGRNILVSRKDYEYGITETHCSTVPFAGGGYFKGNFEFEGLAFNFIDEDQSLASGIDIITLGGHTPELLGLVLHLDEGTVIFPSDAVYMSKNYGPPATRPGIVYDTLGFDKSIRKLYSLQKKYNAKIIFPHDSEQFSTLKQAPYFYG
ncbi:N-acyl homoserine lactonase family protein [Petroclostridium sp. X23]|uniref:N-acyl homoserine lactonase family protein n=1 Tax=Petroclostridium sp. X23 TaxID=3045146 RepID=UPI0024ADB94B|nr:N-acyl homoserine lactonase family protein [Petroclostridium sp. X23]WHH58180.1 N-acyl homoserine lactonase family protein [Petroclostridium sp. X23]